MLISTLSGLPNRICDPIPRFDVGIGIKMSGNSIGYTPATTVQLAVAKLSFTSGTFIQLSPTAFRVSPVTGHHGQLSLLLLGEKVCISLLDAHSQGYSMLATTATAHAYLPLDDEGCY